MFPDRHDKRELPTSTKRGDGIPYFREALELSKTHFNSTYAFLLAHDPPGLWEHLGNEEKFLGDAEVIGRIMSDLVSTSQGKGGNSEASALSQLQYYTRDLRKKENDPSWVCKWQEQVLDVFPESKRTSADWGLIYFTSFLR